MLSGCTTQDTQTFDNGSMASWVWQPENQLTLSNNTVGKIPNLHSYLTKKESVLIENESLLREGAILHCNASNVCCPKFRWSLYQVKKPLLFLASGWTCKDTHIVSLRCVWHITLHTFQSYPFTGFCISYKLRAQSIIL